MPEYPYKIPMKEMVERYERNYTAAINDIFRPATFITSGWAQRLSA